VTTPFTDPTRDANTPGAHPPPSGYPGAAFPPPPGYSPTDPNMQAFFAQAQAYQRFTSTQGVSMIRQNREIRRANARVVPLLLVGVSVLTLGAFSVMPLLPRSLFFLPILVVLAAVGAMVPWMVRQQRAARKVHDDFIDAVLEQQEAFQRGSYPDHPPAQPPAY
jgi:hypothetical protein